MEYKEGIQNIIYLRKKAYSFSLPIVIILLLAILVNSFLPALSPLLGTMAFLLFYKNILKAAHEPCPKCNEPFGTKSKFVLGVGTEKCQNCSLSIYEQ